MEITKAMDHLNNINTWKVDNRVLSKIQDTGFDRFLQLSLPVRHNFSLISALIDCYDESERCFIFNNHKLLFSLEDILCITGLPVDGKPVTGVDSHPTMLCTHYLGSNGCKGKSGEVQFDWLKSNFEVVPEGIDGNSPELEPYVRAYLLYLIGSLVFPDKCGGSVSVVYLPLLGKLEEVRDYAWGAALLAHLHISLAKAKKECTSSVRGNTFSLMIFAMEHVPKLAAAIFGLTPCYPTKFPLLEGWTKLLRRPSKNNYKKIKFLEIIENLDEDDIVWQPYKRLPKDFLPNYCAQQDKLGKSRTILICFEKAAYHRPDLCPKQFGIEAVDHFLLRPLVDLKIESRSGPKGKDWCTHGAYKTYLEEWDSRDSCLIDNFVSFEDHISSQVGELANLKSPQCIEVTLLPDSQPSNGNAQHDDYMSLPMDIDVSTTFAETKTEMPNVDIPLSWPLNGNLTQDWIEGLMAIFDWSSRNLSPSQFSSVLPIPVFNKLVLTASKILHDEPNCVRVDNCGPDSSVVVVGDVHGQLHDVLFLLKDAGFPCENRLFVFNGDYVDRGAWGVETLLLLLVWKVFLPNRVYLLRGNHETKYCTSLFGFENEIITKYGDKGKQLYKKCLKCFEGLPLASIIAGRVYTTHGGLFRSVSITPMKRPRGKKNNQLEELNNYESGTLSLGSLDELSKAKRSVLDPPWEGLNMIPGDVLWSDPSMNLGLSPNKERGIGLLWGPDCTEDFLKKFNLKLIIRSHEGPDSRENRCDLSDIDEGYTIDHVVESGKLITLFSAPDYPQFQATEERYKNKGAYIVLEPPDFDVPKFYSFEAVTPRPEVNPYYDYEHMSRNAEVDFSLMVPVSKRAVFTRRIDSVHI